MDHGPAAPGGQHPGPRPAPSSARARLTAAVRDDAHGPGAVPRAADPLPQLPPDEGLEPVRRLGRGSWLVREVRSGEPFVLRTCTGTTAPERTASRRALRALVVDLAGREHPHLVAVRGLLGPAAEPVGLVEEFLEGGSLAERLADRGRLTPEEVAGVLRDTAAGLAVLHGLGRCHGSLTARQVIFRGAGPGTGPGAGLPPAALRPAALRPGAAAGSPPDDVRDLGVVCWTALTGRAPGPGGRRAPLARLCPDAAPGLLHAVEAALAPDPSGRPSAAELAAGLTGAAEAGPPGAVPGGSGTGRAHGHSPARGSRRRAAVPAAAAVLLLAVGTVVLRASPEPAAPSPAAASAGPTGRLPAPVLPAPTRPVSADPEPSRRAAAVPGAPHEALRRLVALRGEALRTGDARLLDQVYTPGAQAAAADRVAIERAARAGGQAFADLELKAGPIRETEPRTGPAEPAGVTLEVEVRVEGYRGGPGTIPAVVPSGDGWVQTVVVLLVPGEEGWRLAAVEPAREGGAVPGPATGNPRH